MSEAKFTPGPWQYLAGPLRDRFPVRIHEIVTSGAGTVIVKWPGFDGLELSKREIAANVRLIAQAPELYAALEELILRGQNIGQSKFPSRAHYDAYVDADQAARAALAKARGEST